MERLTVYTIIQSNENGKDFWLRVGTAFINRDGSLNVVLNALPINGRLHIREAAQPETYPLGKEEL